jgi:hypothetical protein
VLAAAAELLVDTGVVTVEEVVVDITWQNAQGQMETSRRIGFERGRKVSNEPRYLSSRLQAMKNATSNRAE